MQFSTLTVLLLTPALAVAQASDYEPYDLAEERRPFDQGDLEMGLGLGFGGGGGDYVYGVGGAVAYYVLPGLAPGLDVAFQGGSRDGDTQTHLLVPLKWVLIRSYRFAPFVIVQGGRIFMHDEGFDSMWIVGGGPGFHLFSSERIGIRLQAIFYRLFPAEACEDVLLDGCTGYRIGLGLSFLL